MPKAINLQSKGLIASLISYFERERDNQGPLISLNAVRERVANALNISIGAVSRVSQSLKSGLPLQEPKQKKKRIRPICDICDGQKFGIRDVIYDMHAKRIPVNLDNILKICKDKELFQGGRSSLRTVLLEMGFKWKTVNKRKVLMEQKHIVQLRIAFLRKYMKLINSNDPRPVIFLDETWIFQNGSAMKTWDDGSSKCLQNVKSEGKRYIIVHAGSAQGFVTNAELIFASKENTGDYHGEMNQSNFKAWFTNKLLSNIRGVNSVIIMVNAPYHNELTERTPNTSWRKADIQQWLRKKNISFKDDLLKSELLSLVKQNKPEPRYLMDELAIENGHEVIRLPPYHCEFNAIENIWGIAKTYYNKNIGRDGWGKSQALAMWEEALKHITPEMWYNTVRHTNDTIKKWWEREKLIDDNDIAPLIINIGDDDSESDSDCDFEELS